MALFEKSTKKKEEKKPVALPVKRAGSESRLAEAVLVRPRVTEKAYGLNAQNQYVFIVSPNATKPAVKKAVEEAYGVAVTQVRIIRLPQKKRLFGQNRQAGFKKSLKKAIVSLSAGHSLELFKGGI